MEFLLSAELGHYMPKAFYDKVDFSKGNLKKEDWLALSDQNHRDYWDKWIEIFHEFEYHATEGCYFLCYDRQGNLCLATEHEIERTVIEFG